jgi:hypothetical protein
MKTVLLCAIGSGCLGYALASYSMGKNVKLHFNTADAQAGTTHGQTMCQLTALEATAE